MDSPEVAGLRQSSEYCFIGARTPQSDTSYREDSDERASTSRQPSCGISHPASPRSERSSNGSSFEEWLSDFSNSSPTSSRPARVRDRSSTVQSLLLEAAEAQPQPHMLPSVADTAKSRAGPALLLSGSISPLSGYPSSSLPRTPSNAISETSLENLHSKGTGHLVRDRWRERKRFKVPENSLSPRYHFVKQQSPHTHIRWPPHFCLPVEDDDLGHSKSGNGSRENVCELLLPAPVIDNSTSPVNIYSLDGENALHSAVAYPSHETKENVFYWPEQRSYGCETQQGKHRSSVFDSPIVPHDGVHSGQPNTFLGSLSSNISNGNANLAKQSHIPNPLYKRVESRMPYTSHRRSQVSRYGGYAQRASVCAGPTPFVNYRHYAVPPQNSRNWPDESNFNHWNLATKHYYYYPSAKRPGLYPPMEKERVLVPHRHELSDARSNEICPALSQNCEMANPFAKKVFTLQESHLGSFQVPRTPSQTTMLKSSAERPPGILPVQRVHAQSAHSHQHDTHENFHPQKFETLSNANIESLALSKKKPSYSPGSPNLSHPWRQCSTSPGSTESSAYSDGAFTNDSFYTEDHVHTYFSPTDSATPFSHKSTSKNTVESNTMNTRAVQPTASLSLDTSHDVSSCKSRMVEEHHTLVSLEDRSCSQKLQDVPHLFRNTYCQESGYQNEDPPTDERCDIFNRFPTCAQNEHIVSHLQRNGNVEISNISPHNLPNDSEQSISRNTEFNELARQARTSCQTTMHRKCKTENEIYKLNSTFSTNKVTASCCFGSHMQRQGASSVDSRGCSEYSSTSRCMRSFNSTDDAAKSTIDSSGASMLWESALNKKRKKNEDFSTEYLEEKAFSSHLIDPRIVSPRNSENTYNLQNSNSNRQNPQDTMSVKSSSLQHTVSLPKLRNPPTAAESKYGLSVGLTNVQSTGLEQSGFQREEQSSSWTPHRCPTLPVPKSRILPQNSENILNTQKGNNLGVSGSDFIPYMHPQGCDRNRFVDYSATPDGRQPVYESDLVAPDASQRRAGESGNQQWFPRSQKHLQKNLEKERADCVVEVESLSVQKKSANENCSLDELFQADELGSSPSGPSPPPSLEHWSLMSTESWLPSLDIVDSSNHSKKAANCCEVSPDTTPRVIEEDTEAITETAPIQTLQSTDHPINADLVTASGGKPTALPMRTRKGLRQPLAIPEEANLESEGTYLRYYAPSREFVVFWIDPTLESADGKKSTLANSHDEAGHWSPKVLVTDASLESVAQQGFADSEKPENICKDISCCNDISEPCFGSTGHHRHGLFGDPGSPPGVARYRAFQAKKYGKQKAMELANHWQTLLDRKIGKKKDIPENSSFKLSPDVQALQLQIDGRNPPDE